MVNDGRNAEMTSASVRRTEQQPSEHSFTQKAWPIQNVTWNLINSSNLWFILVHTKAKLGSFRSNPSCRRRPLVISRLSWCLKQTVLTHQEPEGKQVLTFAFWKNLCFNNSDDVGLKNNRQTINVIYILLYLCCYALYITDRTTGECCAT